MEPIAPTAATLFPALSPRDLAIVAAVARTRHYRRGALLFRAGEPCDSPAVVAVVLEGFVRLSRPGPAGAAITTRIIAPGGLLGAAALRGAAAQDNHAEALCRVRTLELPAAALLDPGLRSPQLLAQVAGCLLARLEDGYVGMALDSQAAVAPRLLHALRGLAQPAQPSHTCGSAKMWRLAARLSHADLGRLIGAERATVSRALKRLAAGGLVRLERGHVVGVAAPGQDGALAGPT